MSADTPQQTTTTEVEFRPWEKIARLRRSVIVTEKIDGTNACVIVTEDGQVCAQSRKQLITPECDNAGFARWAYERAEELAAGLGEGYHFGEWYGSGIQRRYGLDHKRFALFNCGRWNDETPPPACCEVVPVLWRGHFDDFSVADRLAGLRANGSSAVPGWMNPEGIVVYLPAARALFKVTLEKDDAPKGSDEIR